MKKLLLPFIILIAINLNAQNINLQAGGAASFFGHNDKEFGSEFVANIPVKQLLSIGGGIRLLRDNTEPNLYIPAFTTLRLFFPVNKIIYFLHIDPGYVFHYYHDVYYDTVSNGTFKFDFKDKGGFYLGTGAGLYFKNRMSPYINIQYSLYGLKFQTKSTDFNQSKEVTIVDKRNATGITITAGICFNTKSLKQNH